MNSHDVRRDTCLSLEKIKIKLIKLIKKLIKRCCKLSIGDTKSLPAIKASELHKSLSLLAFLRNT